MQLLCPHCSIIIEQDKFLPDEEILCPTCGSSFRLEGNSTPSWQPLQGRKLGRFELLDTLGFGAFGTVYKARDPELDRTVAIKVPRAGHLAGPQELDRFLREARSAAQLQHPSIVAVYEVSQAGGVPYLVSDLVEGITLADLLSARRPPPREGAELVAAIADALQYAHDRGVTHRDVKPSNIMLRSDGTPCVMDFGLAKRDAGEITMTMDGQVLGTPAFMSPEQAQGDSHKVDGRSDVYSLGVILYQMLTGELPFRGTTRMLIHQVLHEEPRSPRRLNDRIPHDLETICLKAMAKDLARRYPTAGSLADDLRRFLKGEPIQARPVGASERLWRWTKRRPATAALIGVSSSALMAAFLGSLYHNVRLSEALRKENEQQVRTEGNFQQARDAVDLMLTRVGENKELQGIPQWQDHRQKFLEAALEFYQRFLKESNDPAVRRETGRAYERTGRIYHLLGRRQDAIKSYQQALAIQQQLANEFHEQRDYDRDLALSYHQLGYLYESSQQFTEAEEPYQKALQIRERLADAESDNAEYQHDLALTQKQLGRLYSFIGPREQAVPTLKEATELFDRVIRQHPNESRYQISLAHSCQELAQVIRDDGNPAEALAWYDRSVQTLDEVLRREPQSTEAKAQLSETLMCRAEALTRLQREDEARKDRERMAELGEGQRHVDLRLRRAMALSHLGEHASAVNEVQAMLDAGQEPDNALYNFACVYSLASAAASVDARLSPLERERLAEENASQAVGMLTKARPTGFFTPDFVNYLKLDTDLAALRMRDDFKKLVQELEQDMKGTGK